MWKSETYKRCELWTRSTLGKDSYETSRLESEYLYSILQYYYEPGTGRKFRSLLSVQRHLAEQNENNTLSQTLAELKEYNTPLSKAFKTGSNVKVRTSGDLNGPFTCFNISKCI